MSRPTFKAPGVWIERQMDRWNGPTYVAWRPGLSAMFGDRKSLLKFLAWPTKTPTGDAIREWLDGFEDQAPEPEPARDEILATGFGPECHLDESDPNHQTRTII